MFLKAIQTRFQGLFPGGHDKSRKSMQHVGRSSVVMGLTALVDLQLQKPSSLSRIHSHLGALLQAWASQALSPQRVLHTFAPQILQSRAKSTKARLLLLATRVEATESHGDKNHAMRRECNCDVWAKPARKQLSGRVECATRRNCLKGGPISWQCKADLRNLIGSTRYIPKSSSNAV